MSTEETLRSLLSDPNALVVEKTDDDIFARVTACLLDENSATAKSMDAAIRRHAEDWSILANQVVGAEHA
ncbi:MAG: hypothetical protein E4H09_03500 [Spirochaetales bacterium]|nr:MAG: hypothetical protein E4H09_03500 [Spirochaetales bacterium]